ncbi:MAG TPA: glutathione S-transferase family protein, partial [Rhizomicrobium sp.]|nr:glutathione S-transferase family protein [Rhizomicrobium sp.]
VLKTEIQLKLAELPFGKARARPMDAPKGKLPYIEDDGEIVADSTLIRDHLEKKYGIDLDCGLTRDMRARAWAIERMLEDHLYWAIVHLRWAEDRNFAKGPSHFFDTLPPDIREATREAARRRVLESLRAHGLGRQTKAEIEELGRRSVAALSALLGNKPYLLGPEPCGVDATAFGMIASLLTPWFESEVRRYAESHRNLVSFRDRILAEHYPGFLRKAA